MRPRRGSRSRRRRFRPRLNGLERRPELPGMRIPFARGLGQASLDHHPDVLRNGAGERGGRFVEDRRADFEGRLAGERALARCQLVEDDAKCPHVAARVGGLTAQHFWRHVRQGSHDHARLRDELGAGPVMSTAAAASRCLARPKSSTFERPAGVTITLAVFRSRCRMPRSWACATASAICAPVPQHLHEKEHRQPE